MYVGGRCSDEREVLGAVFFRPSSQIYQSYTVKVEAMSHLRSLSSEQLREPWPGQGSVNVIHPSFHQSPLPSPVVRSVAQADT